MLEPRDSYESRDPRLSHWTRMRVPGRYRVGWGTDLDGDDDGSVEQEHRAGHQEACDSGVAHFNESAATPRRPANRQCTRPRLHIRRPRMCTQAAQFALCTSCAVELLTGASAQKRSLRAVAALSYLCPRTAKGFGI